MCFVCRYALSCPDSLFTLEAPAGVCSYYSWEQDNDLHGRPVPREDVERSLTVPTSSQKSGDNVNMPYGIRGAVSLLEPSEETRSRVFADLDGMEEYGNRNLVVGPDEMYLTRMYMDSWTHIHHKVAFIMVHRHDGRGGRMVEGLLWCPCGIGIGRCPRDEGVGLRDIRPCVHRFAECTMSTCSLTVVFPVPLVWCSLRVRPGKRKSSSSGQGRIRCSCIS